MFPRRVAPLDGAEKGVLLREVEHRDGVIAPDILRSCGRGGGQQGDEADGRSGRADFRYGEHAGCGVLR